MKFFNFLEKEKYFSGLNIKDDGNYQIIELEKINNSYFPIYSAEGKIKDFIVGGVFHKKDFIAEIKKHFKNLKNQNLYINSFENPKLRAEITSALKIIGFEKIFMPEEKNIEGLILDKNNLAQEMTLLYSQPESTFYITENGYIDKKIKIESSKLNMAKIFELTKNLKQKHIFLTGANKITAEALENMFYQAGIKVHPRNIWKNFLSFKDGIPSILPEESYKFIDVLSITIPNLKKWELSPEPEIISEEITGEEENDNGEIEKTEEEKEKRLSLKKVLFLPKPKNILKKREENKKEKKKLAEKKKFLPKPKKSKKKKVKKMNTERGKKLFLPKPKKLRLLPSGLKKQSKNIWKKIWESLNSDI